MKMIIKKRAIPKSFLQRDSIEWRGLPGEHCFGLIMLAENWKILDRIYFQKLLLSSKLPSANDGGRGWCYLDGCTIPLGGRSVANQKCCYMLLQNGILFRLSVKHWFGELFLRLKLEYPYPWSTMMTKQKFGIWFSKFGLFTNKRKLYMLIHTKTASCLECLERMEYRNINYIIHNLPDWTWCYINFYFMRQTRAISEII